MFAVSLLGAFISVEAQVYWRQTPVKTGTYKIALAQRVDRGHRRRLDSMPHTPESVSEFPKQTCLTDLVSFTEAGFNDMSFAQRHRSGFSPHFSCFACWQWLN